MKTSVLLDHEPVADGGYLVRALLRIEGEPPTAEGRIPLNLSLVLDRSGSMSGEPLQAARDAATMLVRRLYPEDTVSVVAYDDEVDVVATPATGEGQEGLSDLIGSIRARGCTNLSGGWLRGRDLVAQGRRAGGVNRVVLLTDGLANVGITDPATLIGLTRSAARDAITTTTIGFGPDYDEDLLAAMADGGGGGAYYVERPDQASGIFEEELEGLLSLAAQNVRVTIRPGADADFVKVLHDVPSHAEGAELTLEAGDLYAREPRRIVMEFLIPPEAVERLRGGADGGEPDLFAQGPPGAGAGAPGAPPSAEVAHLRVVAHVLTPRGGVELQEITLPVTLSPETGGHVEPEVRREVLLIEAAKAREQALEARDRGDFDGAAHTLRAVAERARAFGLDDATLREEADDLERMSRSFAHMDVSASDVKYLKQRAYARHRGRGGSVERFRRE